MKTFCPRCGKEINDYQTFCDNCGAQVNSAAKANPEYNAFSGANVYKPKMPGYAIAMICISSLLLIGALVFGAWRLFLDKPNVEAKKAVLNSTSSEIPEVLPTSPNITETIELTPTPTEPTPTPTAEPTPTEEPDLIAMFEQLVFAPFASDPKWDSMIKRWEQPVKVEIISDITDENYNALNAFLISLGDRVPGLDIAFLEGDGTESGNLQISFVEQSEIINIFPNANPNDYIYFLLNWDSNARLTKASLAIATDADDQETINYRIMWGISSCLGLVGELPQNPESIFYSERNLILNLTDNDYNLIAMLYSDKVYAGQAKEEALAALRAGN